MVSQKRKELRQRKVLSKILAREELWLSNIEPDYIAFEKNLIQRKIFHKYDLLSLYSRYIFLEVSYEIITSFLYPLDKWKSYKNSYVKIREYNSTNQKRRIEAKWDQEELDEEMRYIE